jgi:hypothetical protein
MWLVLTSLAFANQGMGKEPIFENATLTGHLVGAMLQKQSTVVPFLINKLTCLTTEMHLVIIPRVGSSLLRNFLSTC